MSRSLFEAVELAPRDPILGITEAYVADARPHKVNLGVGVYNDDNGKLPLLKAVREAEVRKVSHAGAKGYLPIEGLAKYNASVQNLLFGASSNLVKSGAIVTLQALGGTGALKLGADYLKRLLPNSKVWISNPSWENHRALFETAGFEVQAYPYYDAATNGIDFAGMLATLDALPARAIVVLHACCHNPTGVDLSQEQWRQVVAVLIKRELVPFLDMAYQGFGDGLEADRFAVQLFAESEIDFIVSSSFSKSFSLYGERVGALSLVTANADQGKRVLSQIKRTIRTNYSNPPTHGAALAAEILTSPDLYAMWEEELTGMRERIRNMRTHLYEGLSATIKDHDFSFIIDQRGMFSYSGLTAAQVDALKNDYAIYAINTGRICVAALNTKNIDYVCDSISKVIRD